MSYIPTEADRERLRLTLQKLRENLKDQKLIDVGSTAKGTWLRGHSDIDIYVICDNKNAVYKKVRRLYPEGHDKKGQLTIWNFQLNGFDVDLVLVGKGFKKREDTTKHTEYFNEHLSNEERHEVRRMKAYLKTKGVYGAEIGGIVGVAIEALIYMTGSMHKAVEYLWDNRKQVPWIQDPTMSEQRNLLASINRRRWNQLCEASRLYLRNQNFEYKVMTTQQFMEKYPKHCTIMFKRRLDKALDYQTAESTAQKVRRILQGLERDVKIDIDTYADNERIVICYRVKPVELSPIKEVCLDPKIVRKEHIEAFKRIRNGFVSRKTGLVCAEVRRAIQFPDTYFYMEVIKRMQAKGWKFI